MNKYSVTIKYTETDTYVVVAESAKEAEVLVWELYDPGHGDVLEETKDVVVLEENVPYDDDDDYEDEDEDEDDDFEDEDDL